MSLNPGGAIPPYPIQHSGTVLVCGSAWTLLDDLNRARQHFPDAPCIAVKDASAYVRAFALLGLHLGKLERMRNQQLRFHTNFFIHTSETKEERTHFNVIKTGRYDYYWPGIGGVNSGWSGVRLAKRMGFEKIIMCGIPLQKGGYIGNKFSRVFQSDKVISLYQAQVMMDINNHDNVYSMSGWTGEFFGNCLSNSKS